MQKPSSPVKARQRAETLIFDLDGVVLKKSCFSKELEKQFGISSETTAHFFRTSFVRCQLGEADLKTEIPVFLQQWGWSQTVDSFLNFWFACDSVPQADVLETVTSLRKRGFICYLATNQERHRASFLHDKLAVESLFDGAFYSADLGVRKPAEDFFAAIEEQVPSPPGDILFWDDSEENVLSAQRRGWTAQLFTSAKDFRDQIATFLRSL